MEAYRILPIKVKLSIIMGLTVVSVTIILSFVIFQNQKRILEEHMRDVGTNAVKDLGYLIKDDLLLRDEAELHVAQMREAALGIIKRFKGMAYAAVIDREGKIEAHSDMAQVDRHLPPRLFQSLQERGGLWMRETPEYYEFYQPVTVPKTVGGAQRRVIIGYTAASFQKAVILRPIKRSERMTVIANVVVILVSVLGIYFLAKRMSQQIQTLYEAARKVGEGHLDLKVRVRSKDELGLLTHEFNQMVEHLREKLEMQKFVSKMTVQAIRQRGTFSGRPGPGEKRNVTILFSDVRNFSLISERLDPRDVVGLINIYLNLQTKLIENHGGIVDKYIGDQVMAIFDGQDMAQRAVNAAMAIQREISSENEVRSREGRVALTVGIGVNYGTVVVGNMGSKNRMDYTIIGDAVNLAARLSTIARSGQIIVTKQIVRLLRDMPSMDPLDSITIRGRSGQVDLFHINADGEAVPV